MPADRLLGSFVLRISVHAGRRTIALHSVLTGESMRFDEFAALAAYLERATGRSPGDAEARVLTSGGPTET